MGFCVMAYRGRFVYVIPNWRTGQAYPHEVSESEARIGDRKAKMRIHSCLVSGVADFAHLPSAPGAGDVQHESSAISCCGLFFSRRGRPDATPGSPSTFVCGNSVWVSQYDSRESAYVRTRFVLAETAQSGSVRASARRCRGAPSQVSMVRSLVRVRCAGPVSGGWRSNRPALDTASV